MERGQRVGLIKFGSRVDVVIPAEAALCVKKGDRVKGGSSVLAEMPEVVGALLESASNRTLSATVMPDLEDGEPA
jgi:phosphatidylserine decarboxylase